MVTDAALPGLVISQVGIATSLSGLVKNRDVGRRIREANALSPITRLIDRLQTGQLTSEEVAQSFSHAPLQVLLSKPHGRALRSLLFSAATLSEGKFDRTVAAVKPAERDSFTRHIAYLLKLVALEQQGHTDEADALLETLVREDARDLVRQAFQFLGLVDVGIGIIAAANADIERLEYAAERFIALDKQCAKIGLPDAVKSALALYQYGLDSDAPPSTLSLGAYGETAAKASGAMKTYFAQVDQGVKLTLRYGLEEFAEAVRLLSIEDPFDAWDEVARLMGSDWPEGLSAEEASLYKFKDYLETTKYLRDHPFLLAVLRDAPARIKEHFGPDLSLVLQVITDLEDDSQELFILIDTTYPPEEALRRLDQLDREWWLEASAQTDCRLNLDVRYKD